MAKSGRALGPGATVGVLGTGVPRLACLRPAAWLKRGPSTAHLHQHELKTLARGQASRGGRQEASSGAASPGRLARRRRDQGKGTSRCAHDASHDDRDQAGAGLCSVLVSSLVQRGASTGAEYQGIKLRLPFRCNETKTSRAAGWRSPWNPGRHHRQCLWQLKTNFSQDNLYWMFPFEMANCWRPSRSIFGKKTWASLYIGLATTV